MSKTQTHSVLRDGTPLVLRVVTNRVIEISPMESRFEEIDEDGRLTALHFDNNYVIRPGDNVEVGKSKYRVQKMKKGKSGYHLFIHEKMTTTANYITPFLGGTQWDMRFKRSFVNAFLGVEGKEDYGKFLYLLYRPAGDEGFKEWSKEIKSHAMYVDHDDTDAEHVLLQFMIPDAARKAVATIMAGKYSRLEEEDKVTIMNWHGVDKSNIIGQILYKASELKQRREEELDCKVRDGVELKSRFDEQEETYTKNLLTC